MINCLGLILPIQFGPPVFCRRYICIYYIYLCKKKIRYTVKRALPVSQVAKGGCLEIKQSHQSQPILLDAMCLLNLRSPNCGDGKMSGNNHAFTENQHILIITNKQKSILLSVCLYVCMVYQWCCTILSMCDGQSHVMSLCDTTHSLRHHI